MVSGFSTFRVEVMNKTPDGSNSRERVDGRLCTPVTRLTQVKKQLCGVPRQNATTKYWMLWQSQPAYTMGRQYVAIQRHLRKWTKEILVDKEATLHRHCYSYATNYQGIMMA